MLLLDREKFSTNTICHVFNQYFGFECDTLVKLNSYTWSLRNKRVEVKWKFYTMCRWVIWRQESFRVLLCLHAFMCKSTTVLTLRSTSLTPPVSRAFCLSNFSALNWWNVALAGVRSPGNNCHSIFTLSEKTITINYKFAARLFQRYARVLCGCEISALCGLPQCCDGVWTTSPLFLFLRKT